MGKIVKVFFSLIDESVVISVKRKIAPKQKQIVKAAILALLDKK